MRSSSETMTAAVYHRPGDIRIEEIPVPVAETGEVLVRVETAAVCGTDLKIFNGQHHMFPPGTKRVPGHEICGVVHTIGKGVESIRIGQRVILAPNMGCGECRECRKGNNNLCKRYDALGVTLDGGFAEYILVPAKGVGQGNVIPIDETIPPSVAVMAEPFACVLRGQRVLGIKPGEVALVIGYGPIGAMHARLALTRGAGAVIVSEINPGRAALASSIGEYHVVNPTQASLNDVVEEVSEGKGADVIVVAVASAVAQSQAVELAAIGGRINFFGSLPKDQPMIQLDSNLIHYKELIVTGTSACSTGDCLEAAHMINTRHIDLADLVSERFTLKDTVSALAEAGNQRSLKIVIEPSPVE